MRLVEQAVNQRRHALQHADAACVDMGQQGRRIMGDGVGHDVDLGAKQRRGEELPHRYIEALRGGLGDHVSAGEVKVRLFAQLVIEHARLFDHHPFGRAGGTGGEDHIGQRVWRGIDPRLFD